MSNETLDASTQDLREISIAHSPDSDDAFMFYGLATNKVRVPGLRFTHVLTDIETLNHKALNETFYDVTAVSFHAYPLLQDKYAVMNCGGSMGEGYGPMVVSTKPLAPEELGKIKIAIPGTLTSAYLALKLFNPELEVEVVPFDQIIPSILAGDFEAGLIIHEGQLTYAASGLHKVIDLGIWWQQLTGLPLPLGGNVIKRSLGEPLMEIVTHAVKDSIQHALDNREQGLAYAMQFARDLDPRLANRFVSMYVNQRTIDYGEDGRAAITKFLNMGYDKGIIKVKPVLDFIL